MSILSDWLHDNEYSIIETAVARLSPNEAVKSQVFDSVAAFFDGLQRSIRMESSTPLNAILIDWVESRSAQTAVESRSLMPLLATLKQTTSEIIVGQSSASTAVALLMASDAVFTDAIMYLSGLEADALLHDVEHELEKARGHVKRLDKSKSNFIAVAAHELRTPLTLVEGYSDMIAASEVALNDPQTPLFLEGISSGTRRLREIINDMIDVSLLDLRMMEFHFQQVWLTQILQVAERNTRKLSVDRNLQLDVEYDSIPKQPTYADPDRLLQSVQKVLINAVKYTPDGGQIMVHSRELPGIVEIMVQDSGIGIPVTNLPHIFEPFSALGDASLHSSGKVKFKGGGPGLGLPIAKGILEAHGGTIWAESDGYDEQRYPGSTFHIMIPMLTEPPDGPIWHRDDSQTDNT
jgi:signal transduction histidine kinase